MVFWGVKRWSNLIKLHVVLVIRGLFIHNFTYSRSKKKMPKFTICYLFLTYLKFFFEEIGFKMIWNWVFFRYRVLNQYSWWFDGMYLLRITRDTYTLFHSNVPYSKFTLWRSFVTSSNYLCRQAWRKNRVVFDDQASDDANVDLHIHHMTSQPILLHLYQSKSRFTFNKKSSFTTCFKWSFLATDYFSK